MPSFLSQLREASVVIDGVTYPLDHYPIPYIDALRQRVGDVVPFIVDEMAALGFTPDSAPDALEDEVRP